LSFYFLHININFHIDYWGRCLIFAYNIFLLTHVFFLQVASSGNSTLDYLPIGIQLIFAIILVGGIIGLTHVMGPKRYTAEKLENFESGIEGQGNARRPMAIKYFLIAILFVLFDVEVIFFYPYAVNFRELGWHGFLEILLFVAFFLSGFIYIIKKGALHWEE
jgi:NADH-quinone oxidoreductase subunit A